MFARDRGTRLEHLALERVDCFRIPLRVEDRNHGRYEQDPYLFVQLNPPGFSVISVDSNPIASRSSRQPA
jgi:hypothetical protein